MSKTAIDISIAAASLLRRLPGVLDTLRVDPDGGYLQHLCDFFHNPLPAEGDVPSQQAQFERPSVPPRDPGLTLKGWEEAISVLPSAGNLQSLARLVLGISYLCEQPVASTKIGQRDLDYCWGAIRDSLRAGFLDAAPVSRSSQGFLAVPLCYLSQDGNIEELFRLHVWLPDSQRSLPQIAIHSHQSFARSWVLAGEGKDTPFRVTRAADSAGCVYSEYRLAWTGKQSTGTSYTTEPISSIIENTGVPVHVEAGDSEVHSRGMTYAVPSASFHTSEVAPHELHATLFLFDSRHGFVKDAPVLGPTAGTSFTHTRDSRGITARHLVDIVEDVRSWETFMSQGRSHITRARHEYALRDFDNALNACTPNRSFLPDMSHYQRQVHAARGETNRRFGRYEQAINDFKLALDVAVSPVPSPERISWTGELGVVYRQMGLLQKAHAAFQDQYDMAEQLQDEREMCRAIGNKGMVDYQQFLLQPEPRGFALLDIAIAQLDERVELARHQLTKEIPSRRKYQASAWLLIGLSRLALCYTERGDHAKAIALAAEALQIAHTMQDSTMLGTTRFFYGRTLMRAGRPAAAYAGYFSPPDGATPAAALCKEPSEENRGYLRELVAAEAVMDRVDEHGYTALDYAVFAGDAESERLVLAGVNKKLQTESRIRKHYRELFQEKLRPVLAAGGDDTVARLRLAYAMALEEDAGARRFFDPLKSIRYSDFCDFGRLPRSSDGLARVHQAHAGADDFLIFISYRWINKDKRAISPDDGARTQYRRMLAAVEKLLALHPEVSRDKLHIWMDYACVDQDNPAAGVSALPLIVTQCNAFIGLIDEEYYSRAWCCVEVVIIQAIERAFQAHHWYEHVPEGGGQGVGELRPAPDMSVSVADKALTNEVDRSSVLFLERQSKLLG